MLMLLFDAIFVVFMYMLPLSDCSSCLLSHHLLYDCAALGAAVALSLWPRLNRIEAARTARRGPQPSHNRHLLTPTRDQ